MFVSSYEFYMCKINPFFWKPQLIKKIHFTLLAWNLSF